jgi:hypothetical protein
MLDAVRSAGYRPAGKRSRGVHRLLADINSDFLVRVIGLLQNLEYDEQIKQVHGQLGLGIVSSSDSRMSGPMRSRSYSAESLKKSLSHKRETMPRDRAMSILDIHEIAVYWAATLSVRGWRGVVDYRFMEMLKNEARLILQDYGYRLAFGKSINCPFITAWQDHEFWRHICVLDRVSSAEINAQKELLRRTGCTKSCPGYFAEPRCIQTPLDMSA